MRKKHRLLHLIVGCLFIIIMLLFRTYYRPWVYTNHLFDFYLADTYTNLFGECVVFFILVSLFSPNEMYKPIKLLFYSSCGLILASLPSRKACIIWLRSFWERSPCRQSTEKPSRASWFASVAVLNLVSQNTITRL